MAIRTVTKTINTSGVATNAVNGLVANDNITGVILRESIPQGYGLTPTGSVTLNPTGTVNTTGANAGIVPTAGENSSPIAGARATFNGVDVSDQITTVAATGAVTFSPALTGGGELVITGLAYTPVGAVKIRPTNVTATITSDTNTLILLKNGPKGGFTQGGSLGVTAATVNDVVQAIITA